MRKAIFAALALLHGCSTLTPIDADVLPLAQPFTLSATRDYLPAELADQPDYRIRAGSEWVCADKVNSSNFACCQTQHLPGAAPWNYCLVVDEHHNALGLLENNRHQYSAWNGSAPGLFRVLP